jgi:hypothetical protein
MLPPGFGLENRLTAIGDPPHWLRDTLLSAKVYPNFADKRRSFGDGSLPPYSRISRPNLLHVPLRLSKLYTFNLISHVSAIEAITKLPHFAWKLYFLFYYTPYISQCLQFL